MALCLGGCGVNELIIEQKVRDMILYGYIALRQLPRAERHVLSAEIRTSMLKLLKLVITAAKRHHKKTTLTDMDVELAALQSQLRLAKELGYLPMKNGRKAWREGYGLPWLSHLSNASATAKVQYQAN